MFKDTYSDLWFLLFNIIHSQHLTIRFHKVKVHAQNYWNNYIDRLAKSAHLSSKCLQILPHNLYSIIPQYKQLFIALPLQSFVKDLIDVLGWNSFIQLNRNTKYWHSRIDWINTSRYIQEDKCSTSTSLKSSYFKAKHVKLLLEELPTMQFLKATKSEVYNDSWTCSWYPQDKSFQHIWTCSQLIRNISAIMQHLHSSLFKDYQIASSHLTFDNLFYQHIISYSWWWKYKYHPHELTFINLIKEIIPTDLSWHINSIVNSQLITMEILLNLYYNIFNLT